METSSLSRLLPFAVAIGLFVSTSEVNLCQGQPVTSLQVSVKHAMTGAGLSAANVLIEETGTGGATEADGSLGITGITPGIYTVTVSLVGFRTTQQRIQVLSEGTSHVDIRLQPVTIELDEVLAQSDRPYTAASSRTVRDFDLLIRPRRSTQDLLQLTPGLITAQHAGGGKAEQIFLRGFDADHGTDVYIDVDGIPVNLVSHGHGQGYADLHFVIPEVIEHLDVSKGPYSAPHGNFATAGAISFTTRDHLDNNLIRFEGGAFNTVGLTALYQLPYVGPHQGAYLAGQVYQTDGPFLSPQGFQRFNLFGKFHTHLSEDAHLAVSLSGFSSAWDASGQVPLRAIEQGMISRFGAIDDLEGGTTGRQNVNVTYEASSGSDRFSLQGYVSRYNFKLFSNFTFFLEDPQNGDMIEQTDDRRMLGLNGRYQTTHSFGQGLSVSTLGGGFRADDVDVMLMKSPNRVRMQSLVDAGINERNLNLWGQEELVLSPAVRIQAGLRWDYFTYNVDDRLEGDSTTGLPHASGFVQQSIVSPKASLVVSPLSTIDVFANFGTGFHTNDARNNVVDRRVADLDRIYRRQGLSEQEIEDRLLEQNFDPAHRMVNTLPRAIGSELGLRARIFPFLNVAASGWLLDLDREFVYVGDGGFTELSGRSRRLGLDLEARLAINSWLSADADLNLSHGRLRDEPDGANYIPLAPRLTSTGGLTMLHPDGYEGSLRYVHVGNRPANEDGSVQAEGFTLFSLTAAYRYRMFKIHLIAENLFDVSWNEAQFDTESRLPGELVSVSELHLTPGNPRNLRLGVTYLF